MNEPGTPRCAGCRPSVQTAVTASRFCATNRTPGDGGRGCRMRRMSRTRRARRRRAQPGARPLVRFESVRKRFGGIVAVDGVRLDIFEREFFAPLGPSGCTERLLVDRPAPLLPHQRTLGSRISLRIRIQEILNKWSRFSNEDYTQFAFQRLNCRRAVTVQRHHQCRHRGRCVSDGGFAGAYAATAMPAIGSLDTA